jgi:hypothetical protein
LVEGRIALAAAVSYAERQVAIFNVRVSDELAARFDAGAVVRGGRSAALRTLIETSLGEVKKAPPGRWEPRPVKLTVRLGEADAIGLAAAAAETGLTPNAWAAALIRRRLQDRPTFGRTGELAVISIQGELRRIAVNLSQLARQPSSPGSRDFDPDLGQIAGFRREVRDQLAGLRAAVAGNLAYWETEP